MKMLVALAAVIYAIGLLIGAPDAGILLALGIGIIGSILIALFAPKKEWYKNEDEKYGITRLNLDPESEDEMKFEK